jgi:hypothetical protein
MAVSTIVAPSGAPDLAGEPTVLGEPPIRTPAELSRRRFVKGVVIGTAVMVPFLLYLLWDLWSGVPNPLRGVPYDNFYDLQARAMFHGHLNLPSGQMGIEAFKHDGYSYTYFGIFPSLIRMPILLVTSAFDGDLTAGSILVAWMTTALFSSLMLWRLRILMRGSALVGRAEAACYGVFMAAVMGGSVLLFLAATPFIYNEDFAWSVPLTIGSLFAMLGVMERPSWGRFWASLVLVLCVNLDRTPTGYACVIAALLIAGWLALGFGGQEKRRWAIPMVAVGLVPFAASCAVTYAKFGIPVGLPMADQVWAAVNAHRRYFLAANGGKAFSFKFLPSTLTAYLQPFGIRFSGVFPFIAPPGSPAAWQAGAVLDQTYPTASLTATAPLLVLLSLWGTVTTFRPRALGQIRYARIILLCAAAGSAGVLLWGYISQRYIADLMPFVIIAGAVGIIDVWRRLSLRSRRAKGGVLAVLVVLTTYGFVANMALSVWPVSAWTLGQAEQFVSAENALSVTPLAQTVKHGSQLPYWGPSGQLFLAGQCSGLYLSTGNSMKDVPGQQIQHLTWLPVEEAADMTHTIGYTFHRPVSDLTGPVTILTYGSSKLVLLPAPKKFQFYLQIDNSGTSIPWPPPQSGRFPIYGLGVHQKLVVVTDPNLNQIDVWWDGKKALGHYLAGTGPAIVDTTPPAPKGHQPVVTITQLKTPAPNMSLCHSLLAGH